MDREALERDLFILGEQKTTASMFGNPVLADCFRQEKKADGSATLSAYLYGRIQGIREERARRKKAI